MPPENGYSPSSVADDFFGSVEKDLNQLDGNVADSPTGGTDFAESFAKEQDAKLSAAARWAKQFAPDDYAKAAKLTPGVPPEIGVRQMSEIENLDKINQYHELFKKSPQLGGYFVDNPKDLAFANPDELDKISGINWAIQAGPAAFSAGIDQTRLGYLLYSQVAGTATEEEIAEADRLAAIPQRTFGNHGDWLSSGLVGAAQTLPQMGASVVGAFGRGFQFGTSGSVVGAGVGALAGGVGAGPGAVAGFAGGFTVGAAYGNVEQQIKIQTGLAYNEFRNFRDETGAPLDPTVAKWASLFAGIGGGGLEALGISATLGKVPGMKNVVGMFSTQGMKTALRNPTIRTAFTNFAKNLGEGVAVETLTEMGQEGLTVLAGEIAKSTSGQDFEMLTSAEVIARVAESGKQALQVMTLLGPVTSGTRFAADLKDMKDSKVAHDNLLRAATALEENGLIKRSPEVAQRVIDQVAGDQKVYIPAKDMAELFQTEERDLMAVAIPNWRERVTEAIATNDDVELTMGEFMAHLGQDPKNNPLMELVRVDPRHYLPKDIKTFSDEMDDLMGSELVKAERRMGKLEDAVNGIQKDTRVKDILKEQITSTGFTADAAEAYAQTISAYVMTKAKQLNVDPVAWMETNGPLINRTVGPMDQTIHDANELDHKLPTTIEQENAFDLPEPIDRESLMAEFATGPDQEIDLGVVGDAVRQRVTEALNAGRKVSLVIEGKSRTIKSVSKLGLVDEQGLPWGVAPLLQPLPGNNDRIEFNQDQRGSVTFRKGAPALIKLFNKADMSTLLHEASHFFLETTRDFAAQSPEIMADWLVIKKHLKIGDDNKITREQHEQFAKWGEAFFMEGKISNPELRGAFAQFRMWLKTLYKSLTKLGGKVHPEIAAVFDNMLKADAAVEKQAQDTQYAPLNMTAEEMGISPEDYLAYQRLAEELRSEAQDSIIGRVVGQQKKLQTSWFKEIAAELRREAEARLAKMPPYSHMPIMKESRFSIGTEAFKKKYSEAAMKRFPRSAFKKDGLDPEVAANLLGYPTADEMVHDFMMAPPIKEAARIAAEQEMISRYGNDYQNQTILDLQVKRQLAAEGRTVLLGKELQILNRKAGAEVSEKAPRQLAQEIARRNIWTKKFKDVKEAKTHSLMGRMARMAENAIVKGKWQEAADFKRKQLLATAMDVETQRVNSVVEKIRDKAARYTKTTPKGIDPSSMEQIRDLVTRYEFAKVSGRKLERRASLGQYLEQMRQDGQTPIAIPDRLMRDQGKVNYKELTVEELLGFGDVLDNLEHMGRLKAKLRAAKNKREFAEVKGELIDSMAQRKEKKRQMKHFGEEKTEAFDKLWQWTATLLKPEAIIEWLDLGNIAGPAMKYLFNPIAEAQNLQNDMSAQYNERVMKIFENIDSSYLTEVVNISSLNATLTREKIYAIALNMGNLSNQRKLMEGYKFTEPQMAEILSHMSKKDWDNVQKIWDTLDTLWEKIAAMEKRLTGVAPPKVEAHEFTNQHGTYAGGYYPVIYDFKTPAGLNLDEDTRPIDQQSATYQQLFGGKPFIPPGTSHKHTYARQAVSKPIKLSLAVLPGHIHTVIHDLAYREPVRTAYKLLWDPDVKAKISAVESPHVYNQLTHWLHQVAAERPFADDPTAGFVDKLRIGATIYGMGFRFSTVAAQPLGLFNGAARVGSANLLAGLAQFIRHPKSSMDLVNSLSGEMKHRFNAQDRDIKATIQNAALHPDRLHRLAQYSLAPIGAIDKVTSVIVWLGGYSKAIRAGQAQDLAIQSADRDVRLTQGTGNAKDLAKIMSSGSLNRIFTMFYSAFSAQYNMGVDLTRSTKRDIDAGNIQALFLERLPQFLMLVAVPAVFGALITGQGPEEDEDKIWWAAKKIMLYPVAGVPFLRDVIGQAASGFDYKLSPAGKALDESTKALEKLFNSDLEWEERLTGALKPGLIATSSFLGLPTGQAINTIEGLYYGLQNDDLEFSDLLYGRRDKEK